MNRRKMFEPAALPRMKRFRRISATAAVAAVCVAPAADASQTAVLKQRVKGYSAAYLGGQDGKAWKYLTRRCQMKIGRDTFAELVAGAHQLYGSAKLKGGVRVVAHHGKRARVTYRFTRPALNQIREPWAFQRGAWRVDDC